MTEKYKILDIKLDRLTRYQAIDKVADFFNRKSASMICTVNAEFIMNAQENADFKKVLNDKSAINLIDGSGVVWAVNFMHAYCPNIKILREIYILLGWCASLIFFPITSALISKKIPKISGADFVWDICKWASDNDKSIFILGNKEGLDPNAVQKASLELQTNIYDLKISGTRSSSPDAEFEKEDTELIKKSGADIVFCAFGSPAQELWLSRNLGRTNAKIGIGLGGTFDFIAGVQKRAPRFISLIGLEWLFRLIRHPRRFRRQLALPRFAIAILRQRLKNH